MTIEEQHCVYCKQPFSTKMLKVFVIRKAERIEKVANEKLEDGTIRKHIEKIPQDPLITTRDFTKTLPYQKNSEYEVISLKIPKNQACQSCRNRKNFRRDMAIKKQVYAKRFEKLKLRGVEFRAIDEKTLHRIQRNFAEALVRGVIKPQKVTGKEEVQKVKVRKGENK